MGCLKTHSLVAVALLAVLSVSCSKAKNAPNPNGDVPVVETFPITNTLLKGCRFAVSPAQYTFEAKIEPNVIQCEEGVPKKIEVLSQSPLPMGLRLDPSQLALVGTPRERILGGNYLVYLENEAGYVRIPLQITVR
jgi:hypothetical protein